MDPTHDDNPWMVVGSFMLAEYLHGLPKSDFRWPPIQEAQLGPTRLHEMLLAAEAPYTAEIEEGVTKWLETGTWPSMSREAIAFLRIRWKPATYFFTDHVLPEVQGCTAIVPFPTLPRAEIIRWVLFEWWKLLGSMRACEIMILEYLEAESKIQQSFRS